jgi:Xaa-Pro aminopeptidase
LSLHSKILSQYFIHSLGHGVGRAIHQPPWLSPRKGSTVLRVGDAVTIEPGVYLVGQGGVRIEDTCEVLADGARWLVPMQRHISRMVV